jgi:hypothetical protein
MYISILLSHRRLLTEYVNAVVDHVNAVWARDSEARSLWQSNRPRDWTIDQVRDIEERQEELIESGVQNHGLTEVERYHKAHRINRKDGVLYDNSIPLGLGEVLGDIDDTHLLISGQLSNVTSSVLLLRVLLFSILYYSNCSLS